jgi:hypothetical protein
MLLDQRDTPTCVAHAWVHALTAAGVDRWPEDCRTAADWVWRAHRHIARPVVDLDRPASIENGANVHVRFGLIRPDWEVLHRTADILEALDSGPLVAVLDWYDGCAHPVNGVCEVTGEITGNHAVAIIGRDRSKLRLRNSFGDEWGDGGDAWMHASAFREAGGVAIRFTPTSSRGAGAAGVAGARDPFTPRRT